MDSEALIELAAADAATGVLALDRSGWVGLLLYMYGESLSAVAWGMPDLDPPLGIDGETMADLGMLDGDGEAIAALRERVEGEDGWELQERFYLALAQRAHELTGQPVLVSESALMPEEEQLARQGGRAEPTVDPLAGRDVLVSLRIDEHRVAAIWREPDELVTANGYWMCRTNKRLLRYEIEITEYLDVEGEAFAHAVPFDGVPDLWPRQAPPRELVQDDEWRVDVNDWGPFAPAAGEVAYELDVDEATVPVRPITGTVLGHRHGFDLAAQTGVWAAVAECGGFAITIQGRGTPPERLDFDLAAENP